jgi:hypothetical protein
MQIWILIVIVALLLLAFIERRSKCTFLTGYQTSRFILADPDGYHANMSREDLVARNFGVPIDRKGYTRSVAEVCADFTPEERRALMVAARKADARIRKIPGPPEINRNKLVEIPWIFAKTRGNTCENGFPHTRRDFIFVTPEVIANKDLTDVLIHEKVHVYQRKNPAAARNLARRMGYVPWRRKERTDRIRSNPDEDDWLYKTLDGRLAALSFANDRPENLLDVKGLQHPYEVQAYALEGTR